MSREFFQDIVAAISAKGRELVHRGDKSSLLARDADILELADALLSQQGEASGIALARATLDRYRGLDRTGKLEFFRALSKRYSADAERLQSAARTYLDDPSDANAMELSDTAEPRRQELVRRLNRAPGGTAALVRMREDLIGMLRDHPELAPVDHDFDHLLASWFNRGFLTLKRIEWDSPAAVLEKIIHYEAVHEIQSWDDLRRRIEPEDRRCYAFFHPSLPQEPLIFVEIALVHEIPGAIASVLSDTAQTVDVDKASVAVFYSISNCQRGLRGVSFGNFLIKQVVEELTRDLPRLKTFVTLSPIPGFCRWLSEVRRQGSAEIISESEAELLTILDRDGWHRDPQAADQLQDTLLGLAAFYFLNATHGDGAPVDAVARFHLGNGARLERINWLADISPRGLRQAAGLMVNYLYALPDIEKNHELFINEHQIIAASDVRKLLKKRRPKAA